MSNYSTRRTFLEVKTNQRSSLGRVYIQGTIYSVSNRDAQKPVRALLNVQSLDVVIFQIHVEGCRLQAGVSSASFWQAGHLKRRRKHRLRDH